jgi:ABC-2 type transport system permease protein
VRQILAVARKELSSTFGSPLGFIFMGTFLLVSLFVFFWVEAFFARGIAEIRPLFRWLPLLLIFLVSALTMRQWSEEARSGTLEMLLTLPVHPFKLVVGKFLAILTVVALALALTSGLPLTVSFLGRLDWGPVLGGYLAALLLAATYTAIGLFVSSRTSNQIVALIVTLLLGGLFYLVGSGAVLSLAQGRLDDLLRALGTGSRFESIERGVLDVRDLLYYLSLTLLFLTLNVVSLESKRWSQGKLTRRKRQNAVYGVGLIALNLLLLNLWLQPLAGLRADITQERRYSLSATTKELLANVQEPVLIRAYVSENTHPLLAPLIPQVRDLLREYEIAGRGSVTAEAVDPQRNPDLEQEANQTYGIQPRPFQVADRYQASLVNAYFDILLRYGDQSEVIPFDQLIEVLPTSAGTPEVRLRNLEYDLTRSLKKVVYGFNDVTALLNSLGEPAKLTLFVTPDTLPPDLAEVPKTIETVVTDLASKAKDKFSLETLDPTQPEATLTPEVLREQYGLEPYPASLFSDETFYLNMLLQVGGQSLVLYLPEDLSEASLRGVLESALERLAPGFLKTVGVWSPGPPPPEDFGQQPQLFGAQFVREQLGRDYNVQEVDLSSGGVPQTLDMLVLLAPQNLGERERFAVDQYLMRGGSLFVAAGNYGLTSDPFTGGLGLQFVEGGIADVLEAYGVRVDSTLVMDLQNAPFPATVQREVNGFQVQEVEAVDFPFFVDVRPEGMATGNVVTSSLPSVTVNFASPLNLDSAKNEGREVTTLLSSSVKSWLSSNTSIQPDLALYPDTGFAIEGEQKSQPLAVSIVGRFESFYKDKPSPLAESETSPEFETQENPEASSSEATPAQQLGVIKSSPDNARLVVVGSGEFLNDNLLQLFAQMGRDRGQGNLQFVQNAVDWSLEDVDLLSIRARGTASRLLVSLTPQQETFWEVLNYLIALVALVVLAALWQVRRRRSRTRTNPALSPEGGQA